MGFIEDARDAMAAETYIPVAEIFHRRACTRAIFGQCGAEDNHAEHPSFVIPAREVHGIIQQAKRSKRSAKTTTTGAA